MGSATTRWLVKVSRGRLSLANGTTVGDRLVCPEPRTVDVWRAYKALRELNPMRGMMGTQSSPVKSYDYLLKFLLVGDSDVGKGEILDSLQDGSVESPYAYSSGE